MRSSMEKTIDLYVKKEGAAREKCFSTIGEAIEAMERIAPVPEEIAAELEKGRIYPSPVYEVTPFVVHIGAGEYREKLVLWILFSAPAPLILRSVLFFPKSPGTVPRRTEIPLSMVM